tara:strand:+ start:4989 stop:5222 length:234 start_codon:yes stop_codon:yes gene_type:complete
MLFPPLTDKLPKRVYYKQDPINVNLKKNLHARFPRIITGANQNCQSLDHWPFEWNRDMKKLRNNPKCAWKMGIFVFR